MVEGGEVVVVELDVGALHHAVSEPDETRPRSRAACGSAGSRRRSARRGARHRHVDRARGQRALELPASSSASRPRARPRAPGAPRSPPNPPGRARPPQLGDPAQDRGQLGLAGRGSGRAAARARRCPRPPRSPPMPPRAGCRSARSCGGRRYPSDGYGRRRGDIQRFDPGVQLDRPQAVTARHHVLAGGLRARRRAERANGPFVGGVPPWATSPTTGSAGSSRVGGMPKIEPMLARTAFGRNGSAHPAQRPPARSAVHGWCG